MTTAATIHNYLQSPFLICVREDELHEVNPFEYLWRCIQWIFIGDAAFEDCKVAKVVEVAGRVLHGGSLDDKWDVVEFYRTLASRVRKPELQRKLTNTTNQTAMLLLAPKRRLVSDALSYMWENLEPSRVFEEARKVLVSLNAQMAHGLRTPLPLWFHATPSEWNVSSIVNLGMIFQHQAVRGFGTYVSSADEAGECIGYGRFTFALDSDEIEAANAAFFIPNPETNWGATLVNRLCGWKTASVWVRVAQNLSVGRNSLAFIAYPPEMDIRNLQWNYPQIRFVPRDVSDKITEIFRQTTKRALPSHWYWMDGISQKGQLPSHLLAAS